MSNYSDKEIHDDAIITGFFIGVVTTSFFTVFIWWLLK